MNIALVYPRLHYSSGDPPLGLGYLASNIPPVFRRNLTIIDGTFLPSLDAMYRLLTTRHPDIVGIYFDTMNYGRGIKIARKARELNAFVIAGGPHATVMPHTIIDHVDAIALGEAEITFAEIIQRSRSFDMKGIEGIWFKNGSEIVKNRPRGPVADLDRLNFPERRLFDMERYMAAWHYLDILSTKIRGTNVVASRACPFNCTYCQPTLDRMFGKKLRMRTPRNIVAEIKKLKNDYGVRGIFFHDDTLTINKPWLNELCDRLTTDCADILWACNTRADVKDEDIFKKMYRAGLRYIHIGVESGSPRILDSIYRKRIKLEDIRETIHKAKKTGIRVGCFFMLGAPTETREEINRTIRFASTLDIDEATFNITNPFPTTYLHDMVKELNYNLSEDFSDYNYYSRRAFDDPQMSTRRLKYYQRKALFNFYLKPRRWGYLLSHLTSAGGIGKLLAKIGRFYK
jgi:anaerobic magnesium-protoporphyrin IX monomethyl ester cyclase